jgi:hypothetical protein
MLIHDKFVFFHMPKTAGTFITHVLKSELSITDGPGFGHSSWYDLPPDAANKPVLFFVRNPWDWYVSFYHFLEQYPEGQTDRKQLVRRFLFDENSNDFATAVRNACTRLSDPNHPAVREMIAELPSDHPTRRLMLGRHDYYSAVYLTMLGERFNSKRLTIGRFENLIEDLQQFLFDARVSEADRVMRRIRAEEPLNLTVHRPYREYYDDELRDLVGQSCKVLIDQYDYKF